MRQQLINDGYDHGYGYEACPKCKSVNTSILNFFYPERGDVDQRCGHQAECKDCEEFWDTYYHSKARRYNKIKGLINAK